jgi:hypothetical protein
MGVVLRIWVAVSMAIALSSLARGRRMGQPQACAIWRKVAREMELEGIARGGSGAPATSRRCIIGTRRCRVIIEERLRAMGIVLPPPVRVPEGVRLPFAPVRIVGDRAIVSGHGPQNGDGTSAGPFGKVGGEVSVEEGYDCARRTGISILGSLSRALGDLDRITAWVRVFGMVASAPGFQRQPAVINGFSDLVIELFGDEVGAHARSAVGMAELPFGLPVEIEAEVAFRP